MSRPFTEIVRLIEAYEARFPGVYFPFGFVCHDDALAGQIEAALREGVPLPYTSPGPDVVI